MKHLFKVKLPNSSLFIHNINLELGLISYSVRDEYGELLEPVSINSKLELIEDKPGVVWFDKRFLPNELLSVVIQTLHSNDTE